MQCTLGEYLAEGSWKAYAYRRWVGQCLKIHYSCLFPIQDIVGVTPQVLVRILLGNVCNSRGLACCAGGWPF